MTAIAVVKGPADVLDFDIDLSRWLPEGDYIQSAICSVDPDSDDFAASNVQWSVNVIKVWLSGGTDGATYSVDVVATTSQGRIKTICFAAKIRSCH